MFKIILLPLLVTLLQACQQNCNACVNAICTACADQYYLTIDGGCVQNVVSNCALYDPSNSCLNCQSTYTLIDSTCQKDYSGCIQSTYDSSCNLCAVGMILANNTCEGVLNCKISGLICNECLDNFILENNTCIDISAACLLANQTSGICLICSEGFSLIGYQCLNDKIRPMNCYIYNSSGQCLTCKQGYVLNTLSNCVIPGNSICQEFDSNGNCIICQNSLMSIINGSCVDIHCKIGSSGNCQQCQKGFSTVNNTVCVLIDPNCLSATNDSTVRCDTCKKGYYVNITGICNVLPQNCMYANIISGVCIQCSLGYIFSAKSTCDIPLRINNCQQVDQRNAVCLACNINYFLSKGACIQVSSLCVGYDPNSGTCLGCKTGYTNYGGRCMDTNCANQVGDVCNQCKVNFLVDRSIGICKFNDPNCAILTSMSCNQCKPGYYQGKTVCIAYPSFCAAFNGGVCQSCTIGFSLINGICVVPVANCQDYSLINSLSTCIACNLAFSLVNGSCIGSILIASKDVNCIRVSNNVCSQCSNRYYMANNICVPVNDNCKSYNPTNGNCTDCYLGYVVSSGMCIPQASQNDPNCKNRTNNKCQSCYQGYYLNATLSCVATSPLCKSSNSTSGSCLSCFQGYTLIRGTCIVTSNDPNCIKFDLSGICLTCSSRFYMKNKLCTPISPLCKTYNITTGICLSCYPGYYLSSGSCFTGNDPNLDVNCKLRGGNNVCVQCYPNYYLSQNLSCILSNPLCKTFDSSSGKCLTCYPGFIISDSTCIVPNDSQTDPNCVNYLNAKYCQQCYAGFYVLNGVCSKINVLCKTYSVINGWCTSCYPGYSLTVGGLCDISQNYALSTNDPYCTVFSGINCLQCSNGYYLINGHCSQINPLCKIFNQSSGNCTSCYQGYTLDSQGSCSIAVDIQIPFCLVKTSDGSYCQTCMQGYYLQTPSQCSAVSILCMTSDLNTGNCLSCILGYFLSFGQCIYPSMGYDANCISYDTSAYCSSCKPGYYLLNYICSLIDVYCSQFDFSTSTCSSCGGGKTAQGSKCV